MNDQEHIEQIINNTFEVIQQVYKCQQEAHYCIGKSKKSSRILFPKKRNGETRISEQELRFVFVEQLNKEIANDWNVFYSVETPTNDTYLFSKTDEPRADPNGQSGNFDLVIHDNNFNRIALIEFKANNPIPKEYDKDFCKLNNCKENVKFKYFIQIVKNTDSGTFSNLHKKIGDNKVIFKCWSLEKEKNITDNILNIQL
jgi:hypothetical protein